MATMFCGGTSGRMLWTVLKTKPPPGMRNYKTPEETLKYAKEKLARMEAKGEQTPEELAKNLNVAKYLAGVDEPESPNCQV